MLRTLEKDEKEHASAESEFATAIKPENKDFLPITDRGLLYGDGIFRTLALIRGQLHHEESQYEALKKDCQALDLWLPDRQQLKAEFLRLAAGWPAAVGKIIITRGSGKRGYAVLEQGLPTIFITAEPCSGFFFHRKSLPVSVGISLVKALPAPVPALAGVKHLNRLVNVWAASELALRHDLFEMLLSDHQGMLTGGTKTSLFVRKEEKIFMPKLNFSNISGATRLWVISFLQAQNVTFELSDISLSFIRDADEVFLTNSLIGVQPVKQMMPGSEQLNFTDFSFAEKLQTAF